MVYNQLTLAVEQLVKRNGSIRTFENIVLVDFDHRHVGSQLGELVRVARVFFLLLEEL